MEQPPRKYNPKEELGIVEAQIKATESDLEREGVNLRDLKEETEEKTSGETKQDEDKEPLSDTKASVSKKRAGWKNRLALGLALGIPAGVGTGVATLSYLDSKNNRKIEQPQKPESKNTVKLYDKEFRKIMENGEEILINEDYDNNLKRIISVRKLYQNGKYKFYIIDENGRWSLKEDLDFSKNQLIKSITEEIDFKITPPEKKEEQEQKTVPSPEPAKNEETWKKITENASENDKKSEEGRMEAIREAGGREIEENEKKVLILGKTESGNYTKFSLDGQIELYADGKKIKTKTIKNYLVWHLGTKEFHISIKDSKFVVEKVKDADASEEVKKEEKERLEKLKSKNYEEFTDESTGEKYWILTIKGGGKIVKEKFLVDGKVIYYDKGDRVIHELKLTAEQMKALNTEAGLLLKIPKKE